VWPNIKGEAMKKETRANTLSLEQSVEEMSFEIIELDDRRLELALGGAGFVPEANTNCPCNQQCPTI
jgi:hypothetical protein